MHNHLEISMLLELWLRLWINDVLDDLTQAQLQENLRICGDFVHT